nr:protein F25E5.6 [imported] - Caenorhabditis elegans [Caenorhabditis elegans]
MQCQGVGDCFDLTKRIAPVKCRACRFEKCVLKGMNPNAMQIDEKEESAKNYKHLKKLKNQYCQKDSEHSMEKKQTINSIDAIETKMQKLVDALSYLEIKLRKFRLSAYNPHWSTIPCLEEFLLLENKICLADKSGPMPGWPLKTQPAPPKIPEFRNNPSGRPYFPDKKTWLLYDLMVSIEYAKTFMFFHQLGTRDRLILMRYVSLALMNLHISYFTVAKKFDTIIHPDGSLAPMNKGMVYAETVMSMAPLIRCNIQEIEYILLKAICLCNPAVPELSTHAQKILAKEREQYADALFDHCIRSRTNGPAQFAELISMVDILERQQRMQKDLHLLHIAPYASKFPQNDRMLLVDDIMNY